MLPAYSTLKLSSRVLNPQLQHYMPVIKENQNSFTFRTSVQQQLLLTLQNVFMYEILDLNSMYVSHFHTFEYYADMLFPLVEPFAFCRFESSSHAISMSAYLREQRRELYSKSGELQGEERDGWMNWAV